MTCGVLEELALVAVASPAEGPVDATVPPTSKAMGVDQHTAARSDARM
jgi:hypothetical protein